MFVCVLGGIHLGHKAGCRTPVQCTTILRKGAEEQSQAGSVTSGPVTVEASRESVLGKQHYDAGSGTTVRE